MIRGNISHNNAFGLRTGSFLVEGKYHSDELVIGR